MASREHYKQNLQTKLDKLLNQNKECKPVKSVKLNDTCSSEQGAEEFMNKTLRSVYRNLVKEDKQSEAHYRQWLRKQGRNDKGFIAATVINDALGDSGEVQLSPQDRMKLACMLNDESRLSFAKEVYEAKSRDYTFKEFLNKNGKLYLLDADSTYKGYIKDRSDDFWCDFIANKMPDEDVTIFNVHNDTGKAINP